MALSRRAQRGDQPDALDLAKAQAGVGCVRRPPSVVRASHRRPDRCIVGAACARIASRGAARGGRASHLGPTRVSGHRRPAGAVSVERVRAIPGSPLDDATQAGDATMSATDENEPNLSDGGDRELEAALASLAPTRDTGLDPIAAAFDAG